MFKEIEKSRQKALISSLKVGDKVTFQHWGRDKLTLTGTVVDGTERMAIEELPYYNHGDGIMIHVKPGIKFSGSSYIHNYFVIGDIWGKILQVSTERIKIV